MTIRNNPFGDREFLVTGRAAHPSRTYAVRPTRLMPNRFIQPTGGRLHDHSLLFHPSRSEPCATFTFSGLGSASLACASSAASSEASSPNPTPIR
jgi:hypothetical protein